MTYVSSCCIVLASCLASSLGVGYGQTAPAALTFEVASVKPSGPLDPQKIMSGKMRIGKKIDKARVEYSTMALGDLIMEAYKIRSYQLTGPDWMQGMSAPRFDIEAKLPAGATEEQVPAMLQALLSERFNLKVHKDSKEHSIYALVVAKTGLKMKPAEAEPEATDNKTPNGVQVSGDIQSSKGVTVRTGATGNVGMKMSPDGKSMRMELSKASMPRIVELLSRLVDRPVVDFTELKGDYQMALDLSMSGMRALAAAAGGGPMPGGGGGDSNKMVEASDPGGSIFESLQGLGLKLEPRKAQVETIVVDHLDKTPTEN